MTDIVRPIPLHCFPLTDATVLELYEYVFAPWVKMLGLCEFKVSPGVVSAMFPQNDALKLQTGAACGQAIMAAIDTVASLSIATTERISKGTVYQHTHFLRPAVNDNFYVRSEVLRFGKASAFTVTRVSFASTEELVAHASLEFAF